MSKDKRSQKAKSAWAKEGLSWGVWIKREYAALQQKATLEELRADNLLAQLKARTGELSTKRGALTLSNQNRAALEGAYKLLAEENKALKSENAALKQTVSNLENQPIEVHVPWWRKFTG